MKRRALDRWLGAHGCELDREGAAPLLVHQSSIEPPLRCPSASGGRDELVRKICRDLGIDPPDHT